MFIYVKHFSFLVRFYQLIVKCPNIWSINVPDEENKEKGHEKVLEEIKDENFPKMGKEIASQVCSCHLWTSLFLWFSYPDSSWCLNLLFQFSSVQLLSHVWLFATPQIAAHQASLSFTISQSLLKLMSTESVMLSNHLILCHPLFLLPSIFPSIKVFSNESALHIR